MELTYSIQKQKTNYNVLNVLNEFYIFSVHGKGSQQHNKRFISKSLA